MLALTEIAPWHWAGFVAAILIFLALDLGVFHRQARVVGFQEALVWTSFWFILSMGFARLLVPWRGKEESIEFVTGYIIELSLSMDNVFVIALIFGYFRVPLHLQHRVLFWGILGALVMRGLMIWLGVELIRAFHWTLYVFGVFLVVTGIRMIFTKEEGVHPERNPFIRAARRMFPVMPDFEGQRFSSRQADGRLALTPLALVLVMVETTDLVFAVDSIPAIFAVTQKPFIVFTSNVFAILGLRSLYFVLANAIIYFRYLKVGLSIVLAFIGAKMLIEPWYKVPTTTALVLVGSIIIASIAISVVTVKRQQKDKPPPDNEPPDGSQPPPDAASGAAGRRPGP
jgi:tellurite resistance protein TerC